MGNPHAVIEHPAPGGRGPHARARRSSVDPRFPNRTNVEFVRAEGPSELTMRVWERGVGETLACGTGACAAAVAGVRLGGLAEPRDGAPRGRRPGDRRRRRPGGDDDRSGRGALPGRAVPGARPRAGGALSARTVGAERLRRLPPYLFAQIEQKIAAKKAAGVDVISLGIGDPDTPTPAVRGRGAPAARRPAGHAPVPVQPRPRELPRGDRRLLRQPVRRGARPGHDDHPGDGRQGGGRERQPGVPRPRRRRPGQRPRLPRLHHRPAARRRGAGADAAAAGAGLPARPGGDPGRRRRPREGDVPELPQQPDGRGDRGRLLRPRRRVRTARTTSS